MKHDEENPTSSYHVHGPWNGIKKEVAPVEGEVVIIKHENCAFIGAQLDAILKSMQVKRIVLTGVVVQNSMDATIRAGKALGYEIILPADATTAVPVIGPQGTCWDASTVYELTLAKLGTEYAQVMSSDDVVARYKGRCALCNFDPTTSAWLGASSMDHALALRAPHD